MKNLFIDRFEGKYVMCEDEDCKMFALEISECPKEMKEGDVIEITDDGEILINLEKTKIRKNKMRNMQNKLWK